MRRLTPLVVVVLSFLGVFAATAHAATAVDSGSNAMTWVDLLRPIYEAFVSGHYLWAGAVCLTAVVALTRKYLVPSVPFLRTDAGAMLLVLFGSFGATLSATAAGGAVFHWALISSALKIAFLSAGGFSVVKRLFIEPYKKWLANLGPEWMHRPMALLLWAFDELPAPTPSELVQTALHAVDSPERSAVASSPVGAGPETKVN